MKKLSIFLLLAFALVGNIFAQSKITLEDIFLNNAYKLDIVSGFVPSADGQNYYNTEGDDTLFVVKYSYKTGQKVQTVFNPYDMGSSFAQAPYYGYEFSADETKLLISMESEQIYRHSSRSKYYVYDLVEKKTYPIWNDKVMYATFSPDGSKVAFVQNNNLFYTDYKNNVTIQITTDGKDDAIINGGVDWVYEEEFTMSKGFDWNANGTKIAFYRFDETRVKKFSMDMYGSLYPAQDVFKYPKAGEANSIVDVKIFDLTRASTSDLAASATLDLNEGSQNDQYIPRIKWTQDPNILSFQRLNRHQDWFELLLADATTAKITELYSESDKVYYEVTDNLIFLKNGKQFIISSDKDGYNHLYLYGMDGKLVTQITKGNWEVDAFLGVDEKNKTLYYTSTETGPAERQLYSIKLDGKNKKQLTKTGGIHNITFNPAFTFYMDLSSTINTPYEQGIYSNDGKLVRVLANNQKVLNKLTEAGFSKTEMSTFFTGQGVELNYWMLKPANFDPNKKYPLLMFVYGGPGSQQVLNRWGGRNLLWYQQLAQQGYIIACVDNRGTGGRGAYFKKNTTHLQLGKNETTDQIEAAKYFGNQSYIDKSRIGIWGWSYGGYMSSLCISKGADVFKTAVAVAPVTNWRYYDNIYTERFMRTPTENPNGYDDNSPINHVEKIKGNFLIIHGTADDNVHFQNTAEMVNAMINAGVKFDSEFYPNKNHGIGGKMTQYHLFNRINTFLLEKL